MATCKYCGLDAGWFKDEHLACVQRANSALASITDVMKHAVLDRRLSNEIAELWLAAKTQAPGVADLQ
jgi:hypothetical protein